MQTFARPLSVLLLAAAATACGTEPTTEGTSSSDAVAAGTDTGGIDTGDTDTGDTDTGGTDAGATDAGGRVATGATCTCLDSAFSACTRGRCDPDTGECVKVPTNDGGACEDGDPCTTGDRCAEGLCIAGAGNWCTCQSNADCEDDGDPCNGTLYCDTALFPYACKTTPGSAIDCALEAAELGCANVACSKKTGKCELTAGKDGVGCDDGDPCTATDLCAAGKCVGKNNTCLCQTDADCAAKEDGNPCNGTLFCDLKTKGCVVNPATTVACPSVHDTACIKSTCQPATGLCAPAAAPVGTACDDGDKCTAGDACNAGQCIPGANTCKCKTNQDCADKDDGNLCNGVLYCDKQSGDCRLNAATVIHCPSVDDTPCAVTTCQPKTGACALAYTATHTACEDGSACTAGDYCKDGACVAGTNVCKCKSDAECASRDDGNLCNGTMFCNMQTGKCAFNPATVVTCPSVDDTPCRHNTCVPQTGICRISPRNEFGGCDDGNACTKGEVCISGLCQGGQKACECQTNADCLARDDGNLCNGVPICDKSGSDPTKWACKPGGVAVFCKPSGDPCVGNICNPATGACQARAVNEGKPCEDGTVCTKLSLCSGGGCVAKSKLDCSDGNVCTLDLCDDKKGCVHQTSNCNDGNACTVDHCDPKTGKCAFESKPRDGKGCDADQDGCTVNDTCQKGACRAGTAVICNIATKACEKATCIGQGTGGFKCVAVSKKDGAPCDDGDACTLSSACAVGLCKGVTPALGHDSDAIGIPGWENVELVSVYATGAGRLLIGARLWNGPEAKPVKSGAAVVAMRADGSIAWTAVNDKTLPDARVTAGNISHLSGDLYALVGTARPAVGGMIDVTVPFTDAGDRIKIPALKSYGSILSDDYGRAVVGYPDGSQTTVIEASANSKSIVMLGKSDILLKTAWKVTLPADQPRAAVVAQRYAGGGLVAAGWTRNTPGHKTRGWIFAADAGGKLLWEHQYGPPQSSFRALALAPEGAMLAAGKAPNDTGTGVWGVFVKPGGQPGTQVLSPMPSFATGLAVDDAGRMVSVAGGINGFGERYGQISAVTRPMNFVFVKGYHAAKQAALLDETLLAVATLPGGRLVAVGRSRRKSSGVVRGLVVRTDAWGRSSCGKSGGCVAKPAAECIDANPCTNDWCDPVKGCTWPTTAGYTCVPGDGCHLSGVCSGTTCKPTAKTRLYAKKIPLEAHALNAIEGLPGGELAIAGRGPNDENLIALVSAAGELRWTDSMMPAAGGNANSPGAVALASIGDGGFYAAMHERHPSPGVYAVLWRQTNERDTTWTWPDKAPVGETYANDVAVGPGRAALLAFYEGGVRVAKLAEKNGAEMWISDLLIQVPVAGPVRIEALPDGGAMLAAILPPKAPTGPARIWLGRVAPTGKLSVDKDVTANANVSMTGVVSLAGGGFLASGVGMVGSLVHPWVAAFNGTGSVAWRRAGPEPFGLAGVASNGTGVVAVSGVTELQVGKLILSSLSPSGVPRPLSTLAAPGASLHLAEYAAVTAMSDGGYALLALADDGVSRQAWIARTDPFGHVSCEAAGTCATTAPGKCDDANACTIDACTAAKGCTHTPSPDGAGCGGSKVCIAGTCTAPPRPGMVFVPAGRARIGCDTALLGYCDKYATPAHDVEISAFWIDRIEVNRGQWAKCHQLNKCSGLSTSGQCNRKGMGVGAYTAVNCITYHEAIKYCAFIGGRLPTEAEWEKAARGGCDLWGKECAKTTPVHPWGGRVASCDLTVMGTLGGIKPQACGMGYTRGAGARPADTSPYGVLDMGGNVAEWTLDSWSPNFYKKPAATNKDPLVVGGNIMGTVRGGAWNDAVPRHFRSTFRRGIASVSTGVGFRCVIP